MKREIAMIAFVLLGMGMTASAQFGKKINLGKALQASFIKLENREYDTVYS